MGINPMQLIMQVMNGGANPEQVLQQLARQNPQINSILNQAKQSGMSMEQYTRNYAKQNNIDIDQFLNMVGRGKPNR